MREASRIPRIILIFTFYYQNDRFCRLPIISIKGFTIETLKNDGFGIQWYGRARFANARRRLSSRSDLGVSAKRCAVCAMSRRNLGGTRHGVLRLVLPHVQLRKQLTVQEICTMLGNQHFFTRSQDNASHVCSRKAWRC